MFEIKEVTNKKELKQFVDLPFELYNQNKFWAPPIKSDEIKQLQADTNPSLNHAPQNSGLAGTGVNVWEE